MPVANGIAGFFRLGKSAVPTPFVFDPNLPEYLADPYAVYTRLRAEAPVHRAKSGAWVLTRYQDVVAAFANPALGNAPSPYAVVSPRNRDRYVAASVANNILPFMDSPGHTAPRRAIAGVLHGHIRDHPPDFGAIADQILDTRIAAGRIELMSEYGTPLSVLSICGILGVPEQDGPKLKQLSEYFFYLFGAMPSETIRQQVDEKLIEFRAYFNDLIARRRTEPRDDLISALIAADTGHDDPNGLADTLILLFADGVENIDSAIANAVLALLEHPDELAALRDDPALLPGAVEELLRFDSPAQFIARVAREPLDIGGTPIAAGQAVLLMLASANRDPAQFDDPDRLDIRRENAGHLTFGRGKHSCLGGLLVRAQVGAALATLLSKTRGFDRSSGPIERIPRAGHRWVRRLDLELTPA